MPMKLYTVEEAATILKMHPESLRRISREGKIKYGRVGQHFRYSDQQLESYVRLNGVPRERRKPEPVAAPQQPQA